MADTPVNPLAMLKSFKNVGIILIPTSNYEAHALRLIAQLNVEKILSWYSKQLRDEAVKALKDYYGSTTMKVHKMKIINKDELIIQVRTFDSKNKMYYRQYYLTPIKLKKEKQDDGKGNS